MHHLKLSCYSLFSCLLGERKSKGMCVYIYLFVVLFVLSCALGFSVEGHWEQAYASIQDPLQDPIL